MVFEKINVIIVFYQFFIFRNCYLMWDDYLSQNNLVFIKNNPFGMAIAVVIPH